MRSRFGNGKYSRNVAAESTAYTGWPGVFCGLAVLLGCGTPTFPKHDAGVDGAPLAELGFAPPGPLFSALGLPPRSLAPRRTRWPVALPCKQFTKLVLHGDRRVMGLEWRGSGATRRFLFTRLPAGSVPGAADPSSGSWGYLSEIIPTDPEESFALDKNFPAGRLEEVIPLVDPRTHPSSEKDSDLQIELQCDEKFSAYVTFECKGAACQTNLARSFPQRQPITGAYLGENGWVCKQECPSRKDLTKLISAKLPAADRRRAVAQLARDLLAELSPVIQTACQGACTQEPQPAVTAANQLLNVQHWPAAVFAPLSKEDYRRGDRVRGFTAWFRAGALGWKVKCLRVTDNLGMGLVDHSNLCDAELYQHGKLLATYFPTILATHETNEPPFLDRFIQHVYLPDGELEVTTGTEFSYRPSPSSYLFNSNSPKEGSIFIAGRVLATVQP